MNILIVDDNEDMHFCMAKLCESLGHTTELTRNPDFAVLTLQTQHYDLILCDLCFSGDAIKFTTSLCKLGVTTPLYIISKEYPHRIEDRLFKQGIKGVILKPIYKKDINKIVASLTEGEN